MCIHTLTADWLAAHWRELQVCASGWCDWTELNYLQDLPGKFELSFAGYTAEGLVGFAIVSLRPQSHLHLFAMTEAARGIGQAQKLWQLVLARSQSAGSTELTWKVHRNNLRAIRFYAQQGAVPVQVDPIHIHYTLPLASSLNVFS
jgi:ribosomal protein S18 acetylase RimI-like enzyme